MNAQVKPALTMNVWRLWPWLVLGVLAVLIGLLLRLGAEQPANTPPVISLPQATPTMPMSATVAEPTTNTNAEVPTADGIIDPVPAVTYLPVAHGDVPNEQKIHAGDDSMFLKDEGEPETGDD